MIGGETGVQMTTVTVRYWAAARAAAGRDTESVAAGTLADLVPQLSQGRPELARVLRICTFMADGHQLDKTTPLPDGATIDALPPSPAANPGHPPLTPPQTPAPNMGPAPLPIVGPTWSACRASSDPTGQHSGLGPVAETLEVAASLLRLDPATLHASAGPGRSPGSGWRGDRVPQQSCQPLPGGIAVP